MYVINASYAPGYSTSSTVQYIGFQKHYESGFCSTPEGVACYISDISRAFWSSQSTQSCSAWEAFAGECDESSTGWAAVSSGTVLGGAGWLGLAIGSGFSAIIQAVGRYGENVVSGLTGLTRNSGPGQFRLTHVLSGAAYRIPDFVDRTGKRIIEVKYTNQVSFTTQIRDMADWAGRNGYQFIVYVGEHTQGIENLTSRGIEVLRLIP
jgi:hypothetical protein